MEYRSRFEVLGLPLVHIALSVGDGGTQGRGVAKGWIAIGDVACGVLLSIGAVAVGGVALGGVAIGLLPIAGVSVGVFALGGLALGIEAVGGVALAWHGALGGLAAARSYALGGLAVAEHANDLAARDFLGSGAFFQTALSLTEYSRWLLLLPVVLGLTRAVQAWMRRKGRAQMGQP